MTGTFNDLIGPVLAAEGGYSNNPADSGAETNYGVTVAVARANGYNGDMASMSVADAAAIYNLAYWRRPGYALVANASFPIAAELFDCGVNMGPSTASSFLQRCLNVFNHQGADYPDIATDGQIGPGTVAALVAYLAKRGAQGEQVLLKAIRCLRGAHYIAITEARQADESFVYGWLDNRIHLTNA